MTSSADCTILKNDNLSSGQVTQFEVCHGSSSPIEGLPYVVGEIKPSEKIQLSGLSGLLIESEDDRAIHFVTVTDRGPNAGLIQKNHRPFVHPQFSPTIVRFSYDKVSKQAFFKNATSLRHADGRKVTGLPNRLGQENPVDIAMNKLKPDPDGLDVEAIARDQDGSFWVGDEYGPSIVHFSKDGVWLKRYMPKGTKLPNMSKTEAALPDSVADKRTNRGFEGIAIDGDSVFAFMQSPLQKNSQELKIIEFNKAQKKVTAEYVYLLTDPKVEKIGDVTPLGDKQFLIIELDDEQGSLSKKFIRHVDLSKATNILNQKNYDLKNIKTAKITPLLNIAKLGFDYGQKAEGLAYSPQYKKLYVVNDNDFGLTGHVDLQNKTFERKDEKSKLFILDFSYPNLTPDHL